MSQTTSIYAEGPTRCGPPRPQRVVTPRSSTPPVAPTADPSVPADGNALPAAELDNLLVAILLGPARASETCAATFQRKESDFTAVCSRLSIVDAHALHRRLANPRPDDQLAALFSRFVVDRRARILNYLASARKRAALAGR